MLRPSPKLGTLWLHNDYDERRKKKTPIQYAEHLVKGEKRKEKTNTPIVVTVMCKKKLITSFCCMMVQLPSEVSRCKVDKSLRCSATQRVNFAELLRKQLFHNDILKCRVINFRLIYRKTRLIFNYYTCGLSV